MGGIVSGGSFVIVLVYDVSGIIEVFFEEMMRCMI